MCFEMFLSKRLIFVLSVHDILPHNELISRDDDVKTANITSHAWCFHESENSDELYLCPLLHQLLAYPFEILLGMWMSGASLFDNWFPAAFSLTLRQYPFQGRFQTMFLLCSNDCFNGNLELVNLSVSHSTSMN